jgi:hypothetical protein
MINYITLQMRASILNNVKNAAKNLAVSNIILNTHTHTHTHTHIALPNHARQDKQSFFIFQPFTKFIHKCFTPCGRGMLRLCTQCKNMFSNRQIRKSFY